MDLSRGLGDVYKRQVKGLKVADWPTDPWQALQRLALRVSSACTPKS
jgi:hypothetical protein